MDITLPSYGKRRAPFFINKDDLKEILMMDYYNIMRNLPIEKGLIWLGTGTLKDIFHLYTNVKRTSPEDLVGKKIRVFPRFIPWMNAMGAAPINLPMGDVYTAMERGAIDAFVQPPLGFVTDFIWHEVTDYVLTSPLYKAVAVILVNPAQWKKLSADVQEAIIEKSPKLGPMLKKRLAQQLNGESRISFYRGSFKKHSLLWKGSTIRYDSKFFQKKPGQRIAGFRKR